MSDCSCVSVMMVWHHASSRNRKKRKPIVIPMTTSPLNPSLSLSSSSACIRIGPAGAAGAPEAVDPLRKCTITSSFTEGM